MASFPTIHISCPCSDSPAANPHTPGGASTADPDEVEEEGKTFDPRAARSTFSLFPLENLLYCEDCHQIRCPRCVHDEIVCYFCPNCLFEVPSSTVKTEGNRCTRNCFSCPICFGWLSVTSTNEEQAGPYTLLCSHCLWSSSEIGIEFEKPTSITTQLAQKLKPLPPVPIAVSFASPISATSENEGARGTKSSTSEDMFSRLKAHYAQQRAGSGSDDFGSSPGALTRLMGLYTGLGSGVGRNRSFGGPTGGMLGKPPGKEKAEWNEWDRVQEIEDEDDVIEKMKIVGFAAATTVAQRISQSHHPRFLDEVRPIAALLRTKRSKRCRACRHILVKPESKVQTTRFRIKLVAMNYIPALSISRLDPTAVSYNSLTPMATHQFLLTITNPLFDPISVTLATPAKTPGRYPSNVTILCPDFEVGANTDVWDEALAATTATPAAKTKSKGKKTGDVGVVWDSGRNWTTVVIEIVPPALPSGNQEPTDEEKLVKVPVFVRVVYETDLEREDAGISGREAKERKEHAYWSVLGVGRIGKFGGGMGVSEGEKTDRPMSLTPVASGSLGGPVKNNRYSMR